jgi:hypothetical protein
MKLRTKGDQPKPKKQEGKRRSKPTRKEAKTESKRSKNKDPKKQAREELKQQRPNRRHTTHPPVPCLGRSLVISNVRKAQR